MNLGDWDREVATVENDDIQKRIEALETLLAWRAFKLAYKGYGMHIVRDILRFEQSRRAEK